MVFDSVIEHACSHIYFQRVYVSQPKEQANTKGNSEKAGTWAVCGACCKVNRNWYQSRRALSLLHRLGKCYSSFQTELASCKREDLCLLMVLLCKGNFSSLFHGVGHLKKMNERWTLCLDIWVGSNVHRSYRRGRVHKNTYHLVWLGNFSLPSTLPWRDHVCLVLGSLFLQRKENTREGPTGGSEGN